MLNNESVKQLTLSDYLDEDEAELYEEDDDEENLIEDEKIDLEKLREEIKTIEGFITTALQVKYDSKSEALLQALEQSFSMLPKTEANRKALIFTESTRTQKYLKEYLDQHGYAGKIVTFNGSNNDPEWGAIYDAWYICASYGFGTANRRRRYHFSGE